MLLSPLNIGHYLLDKGMIQPSQLVLDKFTIHSSDSRNSNFIINKYSDQSYFVKQVRTFEMDKTETLLREATCYWLAQNEHSLADWQSLMPHYIDYDYINHILVTQYYQAQPLEYAFNNSLEDLDHIPAEIAKQLSVYHNPKTGKYLKENHSKLFPAETPYVFRMGADLFKASWRNDEKFREKLFDLIKLDEDHLDKIKSTAQEWNPICLIHGDLKFQNFLLTKDGSLKLIDWETSDLGDPCWDIAAILHMYLFAWVLTEINKESKESKFKQENTVMMDLSTVQSHLNIFWEHYKANLDPSENDFHETTLLRSIRYCALKLIHTSFEITNQSMQVDSLIAKILQLSLNILKDPKEIKRDLLQIKN